jgi:pimeloyl-ACP methyl ester carboxylesterase
MAISTLKYKSAGRGPAVVFIHGFCEEKSLWKDFLHHFQNDYHVITPDLPGFGESPLNTSPVNMEYFADEVRNLLKDLSIKECVMIGHSLGGYVALAFAEKYPEMLKGMGLFHSTAFEDSPEKKENRNKTIQFIEKNGVAPFADSFVEPLFFMRNRKNLQEEIQMMIETTKNTSMQSIIETTKAMRDRKDRTEVLKSAEVPVLFIVGKDDGPVPLEKSLEQCYLPRHSVVHFFSECGHMGMFEKREETLKAVEKYLELCF